jgi:hypothetical protein
VPHYGDQVRSKLRFRTQNTLDKSTITIGKNSILKVNKVTAEFIEVENRDGKLFHIRNNEINKFLEKIVLQDYITLEFQGFWDGEDEQAIVILKNEINAETKSTLYCLKSHQSRQFLLEHFGRTYRGVQISSDPMMIKWNDGDTWQKQRGKLIDGIPLEFVGVWDANHESGIEIKKKEIKMNPQGGATLSLNCLSVDGQPDGQPWKLVLKHAEDFRELEEAKWGPAKKGKPIKGAKFGKSYPVMDASQKKKIEKIAFKHSGNMKQAVKEIERIRKGLSDNPDVVDILRRANEEVESIEGEGLDEARKYQGRSRRQVHKTMIFKRRNRAKDRQKKLKMKVKRRKSTWKIKRKRNEIRRRKKFGGGDRSGRSGKIGAARKRRGGRSITAKG